MDKRDEHSDGVEREEEREGKEFILLFQEFIHL